MKSRCANIVFIVGLAGVLLLTFSGPSRGDGFWRSIGKGFRDLGYSVGTAINSSNGGGNTQTQQPASSKQTRRHQATRAARPRSAPSELTRQVQKELNKAGYDAGPADGLYGRKTAEAIRAFQKNYGLVPDGKVSEELLSDLRLEGPGGAAQASPIEAQSNASSSTQASSLEQESEVFNQVEAMPTDGASPSAAGNVVDSAAPLDSGLPSTMVAVLTFAESTPASKKDGLGALVSEKITTSIVRSNAFQILERKQLSRLVGELELSQSGIMDTSQAVEIGKLSNADLIVVGSVAVLAGQVSVDARMISVQDGIIISADSRTAKYSLHNLNRVCNGIAQELSRQYYMRKG